VQGLFEFGDGQRVVAKGMVGQSKIGVRLGERRIQPQDRLVFFDSTFELAGSRSLDTGLEVRSDLFL
jgi:hypothetical protein